MKEIWKKISGYDDYLISNLGRVKSLKNKERILKTSESSSKYLQVVLCKNGKTKNHFIHRLVAETFIGNPNHYNEVNHIDEDKLNNCVNNLEWCNRKYNMNYGNIKIKMAKAKNKKVAKFNKDNQMIKIYESVKEASKENNVKDTNIVKCCKHKKHYNTCGGYKWEYV